ncbi:MAG: Mur ligase family protein [Myxococcota bacterium]
MTHRLQTLEQTLLARTGRGATYGLDRMRAAMAPLGHPERDLPAVHIAGTNGKGSTAAMVTEVARAAGLTVGTFTSPHLRRLRERIRIQGVELDEEAFTEALARVLHPSIPALTFFETMTATAFVAMREAEVDLAVVEVGLGGRLDATNVLTHALATGIVSIGLDHTSILGPDEASIATEKAGIFKADTAAVLGPMSTSALDASRRAATEAAARPVWRCGPRGTEVEVAYDDHGFDLPDGARIDGSRIGLAGCHQRANAAVAVGLCAAVDSTRVPRRALVPHLRDGLADVRWPGRLETLSYRGRRLVLDCAHNPEGAAALRAALDDDDPRAPSERSDTLLFGAMGDKAWPSMLSTLAGRFARRIYVPALSTPLAGRTFAAPEALAARYPGRALANPREGLAAAVATTPEGATIVVAGSIFLVGTIRAQVTGETEDVLVPL